jgi:hypothetical protein
MYPAIDVSKECEPRQCSTVCVWVRFQEVLLVSFPEGGGEFIPCVRCILLLTFQRNANRGSVALSGRFHVWEISGSFTVLLAGCFTCGGVGPLGTLALVGSLEKG